MGILTKLLARGANRRDAVIDTQDQLEITAAKLAVLQNTVGLLGVSLIALTLRVSTLENTVALIGGVSPMEISSDGGGTVGGSADTITSSVGAFSEGGGIAGGSADITGM